MTPSDTISPVDANEVKELADAYNYSPFMIKQVMLNFPNEYKAVINAFNKPSAETIRTNTLKITPAELQVRLEAKGYKLTQTPWIDYGFQVDSSNSRLKTGATHEYLKGQYYIQSLGSMVPVHFLYPEPGDQVLDMCAAPGSKTTQIGQLMQQQGVIVAVDNRETRIKSLTSNIRRCGIKNCLVFPYDSAQLKGPLFPAFKPNKILLDAPCSGSGILRVDPTQKRAKNDSDIRRLALIQKHLLATGLEMLEPGGRLLYSTCSFHYQENEQVIAEVIQSRKDVTIIEPEEPIGFPGFECIGKMEFGYDLIKSWCLSPAAHDTDAFFMCLLEKS